MTYPPCPKGIICCLGSHESHAREECARTMAPIDTAEGLRRAATDRLVAAEAAARAALSPSSGACACQCHDPVYGTGSQTDGHCAMCATGPAPEGKP